MKDYRKIFDENGNYILDENYTEILRLAKMLTEAKIPHSLDRMFDGWQIIYYVDGVQVADAIEHYGSYGNEENLLEIMGLLTPDEECDGVVGWLTAEEVFNRMSMHYTEKGR